MVAMSIIMVQITPQITFQLPLIFIDSSGLINGGGVKVDDVERYELVIGNDCWIGSNVVITCGCHSIGNGAVVGAGSIVTHDVEPYTIVAGNPAKVIRNRFSEAEIVALEKSKWFDLTPDNLLEFYRFKDDPIKFSEMIIQSNSKGDLCKKRI